MTLVRFRKNANVSYRSTAARMLTTSVGALGFTAVVHLSGLLTGVIAARVLGPVLRGELSFILAVFGLTTSLSTFGTYEAVVLFCSHGHINKIKTHLIPFFAISACVGCILSGIVYICIVGYLSNDARLGAVILLIYPAVVQFNQITLAMVSRAMYPFTWEIVRQGPGPIYGLLLVVYLLFAAPSLSTFVACYLGSIFLVGLYGRIYRTKMKNERAKFALSKQYIVYSAKFLPGRLLSTTRDNLDKVLLAAFTTMSDLGQYNIAATVGFIMASMGVTIEAVVYARFVDRSTQDDWQDSIRYAVVGVLACILCMLAALLVIPVGIPMLFGHEFEAAVPIARVLVAVGLLSCVRTLSYTPLKLMRAENLIFWNDFISGSLLAGLLVFLIPVYGIEGALISQFLAGLFSAVLPIYYLVYNRALSSKA